jgi:hypothetical protein
MARLKYLKTGRSGSLEANFDTKLAQPARRPEVKSLVLGSVSFAGQGPHMGRAP